MANKAVKKEKEYEYTLIVKCQECSTIAIKPEPCVNCGNKEFIRVYGLKEVK